MEELVSGDALLLQTHMSNEKNPGCSGYIGDYTTQVYKDYNKQL